MSDLAKISISHNATLLYIELVEPMLNPMQARAAIRRHAAAIACAANFGCSHVRLGTGARLVLSGWDVVTVLGADQRPGPCLCEVAA